MAAISGNYANADSKSTKVRKSIIGSSGSFRKVHIDEQGDYQALLSG